MIKRIVNKIGLRSKFICVLILATLVNALSAQTLHIDTIAVAPFGMKGPKGEPIGIMWEISNLIAQEAGYKFVNQLVPYARTVADLELGIADFVLRFSNDQLPSVAIPLTSIISLPTIILTRVGTSFEKLEDFRGKTVGFLRGGMFDEKFHRDQAIIKYEAEDYPQIVRMLLGQRFDGGLGSNVGLYYSANALGYSPNSFNPPLVLNKKDFILHFSKQNENAKVMEDLKVAVEQLKKQGEIVKIINKYMGNYNWSVGVK